MKTATAASGTHGVRLRWMAAAWFWLWLFAVYLAVVLPFDRLWPTIDRWYVTGFLLTVSSAAILGALRIFARRAADANQQVKEITLLTGVLLFGLLAVDVGFTAYTNFNTTFRSDQARLLEQRHHDPRVWDGELMPAQYQPTTANFWLYKPGQSKAAAVYGQHYYTGLLRHPIIRDSVLELRQIEFIIDRYGLRNVEDPANAAVFVLGDSFCFGHHMTQSAIFPELLKVRLGEPVYNMGVSGTSPLHQLLLFDWLLRAYPDAFRPSRLLWLIFEGNDLEDSYEPTSQTQSPRRSLSEIFAGTVVGGAADTRALLRKQSVLRLLTGGEITLTAAIARQTKQNHFEIDGETLAYPLYRSDRFGYAIFRQAYLRQAAQSEASVLKHPNWPRLVKTFQRMRSLAEQHHFAVTIVTVPTNVRLYKDYFEDLPPIAAQPYFIDHLKKLAEEVGFAHVDLTKLLAPYASTEMIYHRDDTHWNERGHEIVADLVAREVFGVGR